jgi:hypothetical protein
VAEYGASSVHRHDRTVDEARFGREQMGDDCGYLFGSADAAERVQATHSYDRLQPRGSIKAPSFVVGSGNIALTGPSSSANGFTA